MVNVPVSQEFASFDALVVSCDADCAKFEAGFIAVRVRNITHANHYRQVNELLVNMSFLRHLNHSDDLLLWVGVHRRPSFVLSHLLLKIYWAKHLQGKETK